MIIAGERTAGPGAMLPTRTGRRYNGKRSRRGLQRRSLHKAAAREKNVAVLRERHAVWQSLRHTFCGARLPSLSLRGGRRATWRPEREARGSALGVQSREGSYVFAGAFLLSTPVLRDCRAASLLAMTIRGPVPFYRQPVPTVSSAPGGACPSPTTRDWKLRVTLHYPLSIFHLHHAAPTTTAPIRIGGGGHFLHICLTGARTSCSCGAGGGPAPP